ncbi:hypothetical protein ADUPG1_005802, partial [Aduncisulcus paluster]
HIEPPVLKKINVKEYEVFISDHKAYVLRGGTKPIELCLSSHVCRLLRFYASPEDKKKSLMVLLRKDLPQKVLKSCLLDSLLLDLSGTIPPLVLMNSTHHS